MRLIDADELSKTIKETCLLAKPWDYVLIEQTIADAPTIRPDMAILMQENTNMRKILHKRCRRGTWVKIGAFLDGEKAQCSNCGYDIILNERLRNSFNFCPHCGADMRGGAADE